MKTIFFALALCLSLGAYAGTDSSGSAPAQGTLTTTGTAASCLNGTQGQSVSIYLGPTTKGGPGASAVGVDITGAGTWTAVFAYSMDGVNFYQPAIGFQLNGFAAVGAGVSSPITALFPTAGYRWLCAYLSAGGTAGNQPTVTFNPNAASVQTMVLTAMGGSNVNVLKMGAAANQGAATTSSSGLMVVPAADKAVIHQPASATAAVASIAAGGASVRHIATGCTVFVSTVAAQPDIVVNLRDGATGAGTIVWTGRVSCAITSGNACSAVSGPINILGTANTAMTCETATAPAVSNLAVATLTYHDAT